MPMHARVLITYIHNRSILLKFHVSNPKYNNRKLYSLKINKKSIINYIMLFLLYKFLSVMRGCKMVVNAKKKRTIF